MKTAPISEEFGTRIVAADKSNIFAIDQENIRTLFKKSGVLLFRNFDINTDKFEQFTNLFGTEFMHYIGGAQVRKIINKNGDQTISSVNFYTDSDKQQKRTFKLPLHGEMFYTKSRPTLLWFYCVAPPLKDGETTVCDGVQVYQELSEATKNLFKTKRIKYIRHYANGEWQGRFQTDDLSELAKFCQESDLHLKIDKDTQAITTEYVYPAIVKTRWGGQEAFLNSILIVEWQEAAGKTDSIVRLEDNSRIPDDVLLELQEVTERLTYLISWQRGDILMIDNTRMLHGRRAFSDQQRELYTRMCRSVPW
ncbi:MAG TPA: TauD/TfdA family dioxygenase [Coleofasciculaceae cyanobacterium]